MSSCDNDNVTVPLGNSDSNQTQVQTFSLPFVGKKKDEWVCSVCLIPNPNSLSVCEACETPKQSSSGLPTTSSSLDASKKPGTVTFQPGFFKSASPSSAFGVPLFGLPLTHDTTTKESCNPPANSMYSSFKSDPNPTESGKVIFSFRSNAQPQLDQSNRFSNLTTCSSTTSLKVPSNDRVLQRETPNAEQNATQNATQNAADNVTQHNGLQSPFSGSTTLGLLKRSRAVMDTMGSGNESPVQAKRQCISTTSSPLPMASQSHSPPLLSFSPSQGKQVVDGFFAYMMESPQYRRDYTRASFEDEIVGTPLRVDPVGKRATPLCDTKILSTEALNLLQAKDQDIQEKIALADEPKPVLKPASVVRDDVSNCDVEYRFSFGAMSDERDTSNTRTSVQGIQKTIEPSTPDTQTPSFTTPNFGSSGQGHASAFLINHRGSLDIPSQKDGGPLQNSERPLDSVSTDVHCVEEQHDSVAVPEQRETLHGIPAGIVYTWGSGECDQLALSQKHLNDALAAPTPCCVVKLRKQQVLQICCGALHSLALLADGSVVSWGCNDELALGRKNGEIPECQPARIESLPKDQIVIAISAGDSHSACISNEGHCYIWGSYRDTSGSIGFPDFSDKAWASSIKEKKTFIPTKVEGLEGSAVRLCSGENHTAILCLPNENEDKPHVYLWGSGEFGQLGLKPLEGSLRTSYLFPQLQTASKFRVPGVITNVYAGIATTFFEVRWGDKQEYYGVGRNSCGELGSRCEDMIVSTPQRLCLDAEIRDLTSCQFATVALSAEGKVFTWGKGDFLGRNHERGVTNAVPTEVTQLEGPVRSIGRGGDTLFAVNIKGMMYSWGEGQMFQIGDGRDYADSVLEPCSLAGSFFDNKGVLAVCGGSQHSLALVYNGSCFNTERHKGTDWQQSCVAGQLGKMVYQWFENQLGKSTVHPKKREGRQTASQVVSANSRVKVRKDTTNSTKAHPVDKPITRSSAAERDAPAVSPKRATRSSAPKTIIAAKGPVKKPNTRQKSVVVEERTPRTVSKTKPKNTSAEYKNLKAVAPTLTRQSRSSSPSMTLSTTKRAKVAPKSASKRGEKATSSAPSDAVVVKKLPVRAASQRQQKAAVTKEVLPTVQPKTQLPSRKSKRTPGSKPLTETVQQKDVVKESSSITTRKLPARKARR